MSKARRPLPFRLPTHRTSLTQACHTPLPPSPHTDSGGTQYQLELMAYGTAWRTERRCGAYRKSPPTPVATISFDPHTPRLKQLQELHDLVEDGLGRPCYERVFKGSNFASRGGFRGTTAKLDKWFACLFRAMENDYAFGESKNRREGWLITDHHSVSPRRLDQDAGAGVAERELGRWRGRGGVLSGHRWPR